ncbi:DUF2252 family protein [Pseudogulbenkiania subflava]|uniref:Uncharacterized conserved protein, DUF2252 family n=1 Tax=Pseudogulbenkiania subflava DSM 22618 TaxID=1123014 RepID=A0A1Y6C7N6_9NEIS|nr:DUF2252 family protein [Pseudogulbenkiania subflava]SMF38703.1 Uncharacterized conserved protein, DUF2252 family [Pseudogulbenkiania subflava DSM 22618]
MPLPPPDERRPLLLALRNLKMARSPHAYVRGNTVQYYDWLHSQRGHALPHGPAVWICGDCHLSNLGPLGRIDGKVVVQIRDLDQTVIGNPAHDLVRLALSLATAARGSRLPGVITAQMLEQMVQGYENAFLSPPQQQPRPELIDSLLRTSKSRRWEQLAREHIDNPKPTIPLGRRFWPLDDEERQAMQELFRTGGLRKLATRLKSRDDDARVELLDAAYWVKGCSSLGLLRYAVLLGIDNGEEREYCLIDIKEAVHAAAPRLNRSKMPRDNAQRVLTGTRNLSPALGERMLAARFLDRGVFIRELLPQDLALQIEQLDPKQAMQVAHYLAWVVGTAHARQMDEATCKAWLSELKQQRSKTLDAPSWLWQSVVQLVASHEQGYLEHCRKYALSLAKSP